MSQNKQVPGVKIISGVSSTQARYATGVPIILWSGELSKSIMSFDFSSWAVRRSELDSPSLMGILQGFFQNGGKRCYVVPYNFKDDSDNSLTSVLQNLFLIEDADLICLPPLLNEKSLISDDVRKTFRNKQCEVLRFCKNSGRHFALFDCLDPEDWSMAINDSKKLIVDSRLSAAPAAIYFPWVSVANPSKIQIPPSALIAGVMARCDIIQHGIAAAGNERLEGVINMEHNVSKAELEALSEASVNCLKSLPGRGIRIWGVRVLSIGSKISFIREKRAIISLARWIDAHLSYAAFEPSNPELWAMLRRDVTAHLIRLQRNGSLVGKSPEEAFYVKCDEETNPRDSLDNGEVCMLIGLAVSKPAEFIDVRVIQNTGGSSIQPLDDSL